MHAANIGVKHDYQPNIAIPQLLESFNNYSRQYPYAAVRSPHRSHYSRILADISNTQAATFTNFCFKDAIPNANAKKLSLYVYSIKSRDRDVFWPRSVTRTLEIGAIVQQILNETDFGGPTLASLSEFPQEYLPFLYRILQQLEDYNENQLNLADDVQIEVSRHWAYRFLKTLPIYSSLGKHRGAGIVTSIVNSINRDSRFTAPNIPEEDTNAILETIQDTRNRIDNSRTYMDNIKNGQASGINREDCFRPEASTSVNQKRVFNILPMWK
ncbi:hypothetical protein [Parasitella parasitica]|uniref:Uncharacterized protein n=1 Tax=Parasitella parasitica TaxID=35722 RepID=A0A0B7MN75_9FUNG|nr:hypothetical protein [Parasitella parasitica]